MIQVQNKTSVYTFSHSFSCIMIIFSRAFNLLGNAGSSAYTRSLHTECEASQSSSSIHASIHADPDDGYIAYIPTIVGLAMGRRFSFHVTNGSRPSYQALVASSTRYACFSCVQGTLVSESPSYGFGYGYGAISYFMIDGF